MAGLPLSTVCPAHPTHAASAHTRWPRGWGTTTLPVSLGFQSGCCAAAPTGRLSPTCVSARCDGVWWRQERDPGSSRPLREGCPCPRGEAACLPCLSRPQKASEGRFRETRFRRSDREVAHGLPPTGRRDVVVQGCPGLRGGLGVASPAQVGKGTEGRCVSSPPGRGLLF